MESIVQYFKELVRLVKVNEWIIFQDLFFRQIDEYEGYIRGELQIHGGYLLHAAEYTVLNPPNSIIRLKYRFQLQDHANHLVIRWDNAPHHSEIATRPFHKHLWNGKIEASPEMSIPKVLSELENILSPR